jgi:hypothetical protein
MWDWDPERVEELLHRATTGGLRPEDVAIMRSALSAHRQLVQWVSEEGMTDDRLQALVLGLVSESPPAAHDPNHGGKDDRPRRTT